MPTNYIDFLKKNPFSSHCFFISNTESSKKFEVIINN